MSEEVYYIDGVDVINMRNELRNYNDGEQNTLPHCPVCGGESTEVTSWNDENKWEPRILFEPCGHVVGIDFDRLVAEPKEAKEK